MSGGFGVDPAMLARAAQGIRGVVDTLGEVGHGYLAESGRGLEFLAVEGEESVRAWRSTDFSTAVTAPGCTASST